MLSRLEISGHKFFPYKKTDFCSTANMPIRTALNHPANEGHRERHEQEVTFM
jgi:hypothetical protein